MNQLQVFNNEQFGEVRVVNKGGEPWFVAKDVCTILELTNPTVAMQGVDEDEKAKLNLGLSGGETNVINESGMYTLVMRSRKPEAKKFRKWVTSEVLPSIRKNGMFAVDELLDNPDLLIATATKLKEERQARLVAEAEAREKQRIIEVQAPKVEFAERVHSSEGSMELKSYVASIWEDKYRVGKNIMFALLRQEGLVEKKNTNNPTSKALRLGVLESSQYILNNRAMVETRVTAKGQEYIFTNHKKWLEKYRATQEQEKLAKEAELLEKRRIALEVQKAMSSEIIISR